MSARRISLIAATLIAVAIGGMGLIYWVGHHRSLSKAVASGGDGSPKVVTEKPAPNPIEEDFAQDIGKLGLRRKAGSGDMRKYRAKRIQAILDRNPRALMELVRELESLGKYSASRDVLNDAARLDDPAAELRLGEYAALGLGGRKDLAEAGSLLDRASQSGSGETFAELARLYLDGKLFPPDREKAAAFIEKGIAAGSGDALFLKAAMLLDQGETTQALSFLRRAAEQEHPDAMRLVARLYGSGDVVPQNAELARIFLHEAAERGSAGAQLDAARQLLADGSATKAGSTSTAIQDAVTLLFDAKDRNSGVASLELAKLTLQAPTLTPADVNAAHQFAESAYTGGVAEAAFALAATSGAATPESLGWLQKGAAQDDWRCIYALQLMKSGRLSQADAVSTAAKASFEQYLSDAVQVSNEEAGYTPPRVISAPTPRIPAGLQTISIKGTVMAELNINTQGKVDAVEIISATHPELAQSVRSAMATWQFTPAYRNGIAVAHRIQVPVRFETPK
jgi:TonB family protein